MEVVTRIDGMVVGTLVGLVTRATPLVDYPGNAGGPAAARTAVDLQPELIGSEVVLGFDAGDPGKPLVLGVLRGADAAAKTVDVSADNQKVTVSAQKELTLRCGKASITLTQAGKVLIRGEYVLTHASGVNRVRGATVEIN